MLSGLGDVLDRVGKPTELFKNPDGSNLLVLPCGGRVRFKPVMSIATWEASANSSITYPPLAAERVTTVQTTFHKYGPTGGFPPASGA